MLKGNGENAHPRVGFLPYEALYHEAAYAQS